MADEKVSRLKMTVQYTVEFAAEAVARAGGKGTEAELNSIMGESTLRQYVMAENVRAWIESVSHHGYRVVDVALPTE